ncbi:MAG: type IV-A pilus assembly ATPase PilB [Endomicrobia bacterium]|nr:type IV-A pilus assembly ATPase PilB [Endomicrobiia bacterium]MCX7940625.1 type IV-A pilus assembly ATPase PilB [Endomicrobiia bacterium]MDW8055305.1 type IV-A pilus assembly ATPase PilB [Elusimicrobiota bacterium]
MEVISPHRKLGELLVRLQIINEEQLNQALEQQKKTGQKLGEILLNLGYVSEEILFAVLAKQFNIPYISLAEYGEIPNEIITLLPERLVKTYHLIPIEFDTHTKTITIAMSDPLDINAIDTLKLATGFNIRTVVAKKNEILDAINRYYEKKESLEDIEKKAEQEFETGDAKVVEEQEITELDVQADAAPVVKAVNYIIEQALVQKASDLLIEPQEKNVRVRYKIDGIFHDQKPLPKKLLPSIVARIKIMSKLDITERRKPQDGRIRITYNGRPINLRVSSVPTTHGEKVAIRILDAQALILPLSELGFDDVQLQLFEKAIKQPYGMILVTGPTGSGKTTTLYSALNVLNTPDVNIMTVEDPVEAVIYGINQVNVNEKVGLTFAAALRAFLRQDPDVIMVGEIRDRETIEIGINAALTGHLVFATLHTNDAASAITRLINMGVEPFLISSTLTLVISQKLVRKVCSNCRKQYRVPVEQLMSIGVTQEMLKDAKEVVIYKGTGCSKCQGGYKGRVGVYEVLECNDEIKELILKKATHFEIKQTARKNGMATLRESALKKLLSGITTVEEVIRNTFADEVD